MSQVEHAPRSDRVVDAWVNLTDPDAQGVWDRPEMRSISKMFHRQMAGWGTGATAEDLVARMDAGGIEVGMVSASVASAVVGDVLRRDTLPAVCEALALSCEKFPGRLFPVPIIDPRARMDAVRGMEIGAKELGVKGYRVFPAIIGLPPDDRLYYPIYAKAVELGVPISINVGLPGPLLYGEVQRPMALDRVCIDFPDAVLIGAHGASPWHQEMVALMTKHENLHLMMSAWAPKYYPGEIIDFMHQRGSSKVMFASDYPLIDFERCMREIRALGLRPDVERAFLADNATRVYAL